MSDKTQIPIRRIPLLPRPSARAGPHAAILHVVEVAVSKKEDWKK